MDPTLGDTFSLLAGEPQSPGVTSFLRHFVDDADKDDCEVDSSGVGLDLSGPQPTAAEGLPKLLQSVDASQLHPIQQTWSQPADAQGAALPANAVVGVSGPVFTLGASSPSLMPSTSTGCAGGLAAPRRRGRKPKPRLPDLQLRLDFLNEQFARLSTENVFLRNKLKVLERVVPYRAESVGFLTQLHSSVPTAPAGSPTGSPERSPTTSGDAGSTSSGSGSGSGSGASAGSGGSGGEEQSSVQRSGGGGGGGADSTHPGGSHASTSKTSNAAAAHCSGRQPVSALGLPGLGPRAVRQPQQQLQHQSGQHPGQQSARSGQPAVLALCPSPDGEVPAITLAALEELKRVTPEEFRLLWKHICLQLGVLVTGAEVHGQGSPPYVRLERFLKRALAYMDKITLLCPVCFLHSMYTNIDTGVPERPSDNFWMTCARSLQLSPQQLREVTSLAALYEQNVVPVVQQRLQLSMQLSARLATATAQQQRSGGSASSSSDALSVLASVDELAEQLERNVLKEHQTHWNIGDFLCSSVLSPLQVAKALSVAYPYIPDGVAMLHAFKLISAQDDAQEAQRVAAATATAAAAAAAITTTTTTTTYKQPAAQVTSGGANQFPSLMGLLAGQLPALAAGFAAGGVAQAAAPPAGAHPSLQQAAPGVGGTPPLVAGLAKLAAGLPPAQLQQLLALGLQQPSLLQPLLASLQGGLQPSAAAVPAGPLLAALSAPPAAGQVQVQGFAALLAALTAAKQSTGGQAVAQTGIGAGAGTGAVYSVAPR